MVDQKKQDFPEEPHPLPLPKDRAVSADAITWILQVLAAFAAVGAGTARPLMTVIFGELVNLYNSSRDNDDRTRMGHLVDKNVLILLIIFIAQWALVCAYGCLFSIAAMRLTIRIRASYLRSVVCQDVEQVSESSAATDMSTNISVIEDALSEKFGTVLQALSTVITSLVICFIRTWALTLVLFPTVIFLIAKDFGISAIVARKERNIQAIDSQASKLAEECISGIRTITACHANQKMGNRYAKLLEAAKRKDCRKSSLPAAQYGITYFIALGVYALAFWYGSRLLARGAVDSGGSVVIVLLCVNQATNALRLIVPVYSTLAKAKAAHASLASAMKVKARLNPFSREGLPLDAIYSRIEFQDVIFAYPSRPSVNVLKRLQLTFGAGKITAVTGSSGSGKSTLVALLERWYDPTSGDIKINGVSIDRYNVKSLRSSVRVVQQDTVLFNDTIFNNVAHGLIGSKYSDLSQNDKRNLVIKICKDVQAHDFIEQFPKGYDTVVGVRGNLLSGGQKQRIAIARAIISNPVILVFDEATSSLDPDSERLVQTAIDRVSRGRTTIIIAHKLATVKRADRIVLLKDGEVSEEGTHESLLRTSDAYVKTWMAQNLTAEENSAQHRAQLSDGSITSTSSRGSDTDRFSERMKGHASAQDIDDTDVDMKREYSISLFQTTRDIMKSSKTLQYICSVSALSCLVAGAVYPAQSIIFGHDVTAFRGTGNEIIQAVGFWSLMFFITALIAMFAFFAVMSLSSIGGTITARAYREKYFRGLIQQPIPFFDKTAHTPGFLVACLSSDTVHLSGFVVVFSSLAVTVVNLSSVSILGLVVSWRFALVAIFGSLPVIVLAGFLRVRAQLKKSKSLSEPLMDSAQYAAEVIGNIRTVSAFAMEAEVCNVLESKMSISLRLFYRSIFITMPLFAFSHSGNLLGMTLSFWYSGHLLVDRKIDALALWIVFVGIVSGSDAAGEFFASAASVVHAQSACGKILRLLSSAPNALESGDDKPAGDKHPVSEKPSSSSLAFEGVSFAYPNMLRENVIQNVSFHVPHGKTIAIVGPSGSGKSTIISLLERFYQQNEGSIKIGGTPLSTIDIETYRSHVSLVSQDTQLFDGTVRENILLGVPQGEESEGALKQVARDANIHNFIMSLPEGYDTSCGKKGMEFSGGQRQRLAIARALVRNPSILLLDEATSALDSESEMEVKMALRRASEGRTTVAVAHRLSTIQDADCIFVLVKGSIVEHGTHAELMNLKGMYWSICQKQNLDWA
ncbi:ABC transporter-like protein [Zopfia rhizophila CBS 207.26]|uniref:ABC transporter-like protein n=1 Tax=Zopfia rhizophila CBS 207.26 TaxID=1314779 RepID=A0A6A6DXI6_9PEZI|nr:ABC transporter-like protein [Zopfia rhizophila CBS 207.26]